MTNALPVVLVADDDPDLLALLMFHLQARFEVYGAPNGQEALEQIEALSNIDVLVTDFQMPRADGLQVAEAFSTRFPKGKIILITGTPNADSRVRKTMTLPNISMLPKPFLLSDLDKAIHSNQTTATSRA
jgi:DNA-binding NtrC family response regulator